MKKTILIINNETLAVESKYEAEVPSQHLYGGPWGRPEECTHISTDIDLMTPSSDITVIRNENGEIEAGA